MYLHTINPLSIPKASGYHRVVQMLCFEGLCEIDRICRKHNLSYWLDWGTLLGAVRHKGFIPWDDDIDIGMMEEDYKEFCKIAPRELKNSSYEFHVVPSQIGKLLHKDFLPQTEKEWVDFINWRLREKLCFAVDVFPWYAADTKYNKEILNTEIVKFYEEKKTYFKDCIFANFIKADACVKQFTKKISGKGEQIFLGTETIASVPCILEKGDIFPLKELEFEGRKFFVPNKTYKILTQKYGDYNRICLGHTHLHFDDLSSSEKDKLLQYVPVEI